MGKKIKKDDKPQLDDVFDTLLVESKQAATVVLMLDSPEDDVLAKACEAIYKFVDKCDENKKILLDLGAVDKLLKLIQNEDRIIRRNACMALGVMAAHADVRKLLRKREDCVPSVIQLLAPEEDTVVHEFSALCLSFMCSDFSSKVAIYEQDGVEALIRCLYSHDPDVQKNGIESLALLMQDYHSRNAVRELNGLQPILDLTKSEYAVIQELALVALARAAQDVENRSALRELEALTLLVNFVGHPEWNDLHVHALAVLSNCLEDVESMQLIKETGGLVKLIAFVTDQTPPEEESTGKGGKGGKEKSGSRKGKKGEKEDDDKHKAGEPSHTLPEVKKHAAKAIARAARNAENRKLLHETETEKMLILLLGHEDHSVQAAAALALAVMAENMSSSESIGQWEGFDPLIKLLKIDNPDLREAVTLALANLTTSNMNNCQEVVNRNGVDPLINLLADSHEAIVANAACVLTNLALDEVMRSEVQRLGIINALIGPLKSESCTIQSKAALATAAFVSDADAREEFRLANGIEPLTELLKSNNDEVRRSASWAITVVCVDEPTALELSKLGCLEILQEIQMSGTRANRFTDAAMCKMLDCNLAAKYALSGYLGPNNIITDGFFDAGQLRQGSKFVTLEDYCKMTVNQKRPILLINAKPLNPEPKPDKPPTPQPSDADVAASSSSKGAVSGKTSRTGRDSKSEVEHPNSSKSRTQKVAEEQKKAQEIAEEQQEGHSEKEVFTPPADPTLLKYIEEVIEKVMPLPTTKEQVVGLAEFVADKMGGSIQRGQVSNFSFELPISQIKFNLKSNVVPLGMITTGIHYHRALLFKALADRLAVPCSLVRGEYNRAWNEVLLAEDSDSSSNPKFPPKNYIVDLIHEPGSLLKTDSIEASNYKKL
ncbi:armadillo repeat-containing protein 3-like isoform X2 [Lineus longissimus]|uniref:armadillo repeat-containing protein 3-like isoform X2 n=1 Tax=Lineus longissimus TaxID=88925 RepID=UPI00315D225F